MSQQEDESNSVASSSVYEQLNNDSSDAEVDNNLQDKVDELEYRMPCNAAEYRLVLGKPFAPAWNNTSTGQATITCAQMFVALGTLKIEGKQSNACFDDMCKFLHLVAFPKPNYCPSSWYIVKKVLGIPDPH